MVVIAIAERERGKKLALAQCEFASYVSRIFVPRASVSFGHVVATRQRHYKTSSARDENV